jgi:phage tail tape-measure protein
MGLIGGGIPIALSDAGRGRFDLANSHSSPATNSAAYTMQTDAEFGGGIGAAVGAGVGALMGPAGAAIGGIVGGLVGSNVGELIGKEQASEDLVGTPISFLGVHNERSAAKQADNIQNELDGNGTFSTIFGGAGGVAGALIGSLLGPVGTIVGGAIGGGIGGGFGANMGCGIIDEIRDDCKLF